MDQETSFWKIYEFQEANLLNFIIHDVTTSYNQTPCCTILLGSETL